MTRNCDVVLVNPDIGFDITKYSTKPNLPNAILCVGTALHQAGYNVKLIDQRVEKDWQQKLLEVLGTDVICVGISSMTGAQIRNGLQVARIVRSHSDRPIVWGGIHPTLLAEQTLQHTCVDIVVRGEGEETIVELVQALRRNLSLGGIRGISYKENGTIYQNPPRPFIDLDRQPPLAYELLEMSDYLADYQGYKAADFMTSRGCPFDCGYCYASAFHSRKWRATSVDNVLNKLKVLIDRYGVRRFWFDDDDFFVDMNRARELLEAFTQLNIRWESRGARVDTVLRMDDRFLELLQRSGCVRLAVGAESGSNRILKLIKKRIQREDIVAANRKLARYPLYVRYNFMLGFPTETREEVKETVALALQLKRENPQAMFSAFAMFTPYPGCELHDLAVEHGLKRPSSLEEWAGFQFHIDNTAWVPREMRGMLQMLAFATPFLNEPVETHPPFLIKLLAKAYQPLARQRIAHGFFRFPLEILIAKVLRLYEN